MNRFASFLVLSIVIATSTSVRSQSSDPSSVFTAVSKIAAENNGKSICPPAGTDIFSLVFALQPYMKQHPEKKALSDADIHQALSQRFPCQPRSILKNEIDPAREPRKSIKSISPIFGQLVLFSFPKGFVTVLEDTKDANYIRESVLVGESVQKWSQMVTVTGVKGLASNPNASPQAFANMMAGGFKKACPTSFAGTGLGTLKIGAHDAFAAVISCGTANAIGEQYSESVLLVVIKGESDYYTVQWAERGEASPTPIKYDHAKWIERFNTLVPFKLCPVIPGELPPYPSCVGSGNA
jgi:hypothetical protein